MPETYRHVERDRGREAGGVLTMSAPGTAALADVTQAAFSDALEAFRIVQTDDDGPGEIGDELGVGVTFPESGVYVDWNVSAWPDDDRLGGPHVSQYDTVEDAATVAQGEIEMLEVEPGDGTLLPMPDDALVLYPSEGQAEAAATDFGMGEAAHPHEVDDEVYYMPGADMAAFVEAVTDGDATTSEGPKLDRCVESVLEDNPDYSESRAYAICNAQIDSEADASLPSECRACGANDRMEGSMVCADCADDAPPATLQAAVTAAQADAALGTKAADAVEQKAAFSEGDAVRWSWQGEPVHGRVAEVRPESATVNGTTITGDENEAVYLIDEYDDRAGALRRENVAKPESSLDASQADLPERREANYVSEQAYDSLRTVVSESDFDAPELDYVARTEPDILWKASPTEWIVDAADPVIYRADIPDKYLAERDADFFVPNDGAADAARKVKQWRDDHGDDVAGGAPDGEGARRGTQLIEYHDRGEPLAVEYWQEIRAFHERHRAQDNHELDADKEGEPWTDAGYVSDLNWGSDAAFEQAKRVMDLVEEVDDATEQEARIEMKGAVATEQSVAPERVTVEGTNKIDTEALEGELREAVEADDFYVYGKASIEQWDADDPPTYIQMDALENALDRFFESDAAPGIISRHHQDIPVGRPVREFEFEEDTTLDIGDESYQFAAGDTATSHVEDADGDGRPELWLAANIDGETQMGKKTRLLAAQGDLDGFSVTVHRNEDDLTQDGRIVTECDLHAVTIGTDEQIKNKGSEFDVASVGSKAVEKVRSVVRGVLS